MNITKKDQKLVDHLVQLYAQDVHTKMLTTFLDQIKSMCVNSTELTKYTHSMKWRLKEPSHLENKLKRKLIQAKSEKKIFDITRENLFSKINDLAGVRILHLHTTQINDINRVLLKLFDEYNCILMEQPFARTWDDENRDYYKSIGIRTEQSPSMYTSVHYVIEANQKTKYTCEIQVRTLMEEVWGEVNHSINYPEVVGSLPCREQIKALARVTSSCSRLVDSIYASHEDYLKQQ